MYRNSSASALPEQDQPADIAGFFKTPDCFPAPLSIKSSTGRHDNSQVSNQLVLPSTNAGASRKKRPPKPPPKHINFTPPGHLSPSGINVPKADSEFTAATLNRGYTDEDEEENLKEIVNVQQTSDMSTSNSTITNLNKLSGSLPQSFELMDEDEDPVIVTVELKRKSSTSNCRYSDRISVVEDEIKETNTTRDNQIENHKKLLLQERNLLLSDYSIQHGFSKDKPNQQVMTTTNYNQIIDEINQINDNHGHTTKIAHCKEATVDRVHKPPKDFSKQPLNDNIEPTSATSNNDYYSTVKSRIITEKPLDSEGTPDCFPAPLSIKPSIGRHDNAQVSNQRVLPSTNAGASRKKKPPKPPPKHMHFTPPGHLSPSGINISKADSGFTAATSDRGYTDEDEEGNLKESVNVQQTYDMSTSNGTITNLNRLSGSLAQRFELMDEDENPDIVTVELKRKKSAGNCRYSDRSSVVEDEIKETNTTRGNEGENHKKLPLQEKNLLLSDSSTQHGFSKDRPNQQVMTTINYNQIIGEINQINDKYTTKIAHCKEATVNHLNKPPIPPKNMNMAYRDFSNQPLNEDIEPTSATTNNDYYAKVKGRIITEKPFDAEGLPYHASPSFDEYPEYYSNVQPEVDTTEFIRNFPHLSIDQAKSQLQALRSHEMVINQNPKCPAQPKKNTNMVYFHTSTSIRQSTLVETSNFDDIGDDILRATKKIAEIRPEVEYATCNKPILAVKPIKQPIIQVSERTDFDNSDIDPELAFVMTDLLHTELDYINHIAEGLKICSKLSESVQQLSCYKFFGLLDDLYSFHTKTLMKELQSNINKPKDFVLCFVRQNTKFNIYIERQWITPDKSELDDLEFYLLENYDLVTFLTFTSKRLNEYKRFLEVFKSICNKTYHVECEAATDKALEIMRRLEHQIEKVNFFKDNFRGSKNTFDKCGRFLLEGIFKVSLNGGPSLDSIVYLFENLVVFAQNKVKEEVRYVHSIPTLNMYCRESKKNNKLEIGIKGQKRFKLTAESQQVKLLWCNKFKEMNRKSYEKD